jgi:hypothetical protein
MKNNIYNSIETLLTLLENRPYFFISEVNYLILSTFIQSYMFAVEDLTGIEISSLFSKWINENGEKTSLVWNEYIYSICANSDDKLACKELFKKTKEFLNDTELDMKRKLESIKIPLNKV